MKGIQNKINVLFVLIQIAAGGSERIVLELARNLDKSSFNVYVVFFFDGILRKSFSEVCKKIIHIPKKKGLDLKAMFELSKIIRENNIDVVNAHHYMPFFYSFLGSKVLNRKKLIYTEHSVAEVEAILGSKHKYFCNFMLRKTDAVVGVSREIAASFAKAFPVSLGKINSIISGVDVDRFNISIERDKVRSEWGILPKHFVIGSIANFRKVKNHACLIRAFNRLTTNYPYIRLVLVGRGYPGDSENSEEDVRHLINMYNLQDRVLLTGYQEDIPSILHMFDVFCLPSFSEGLPVSILEAMAARVPVVGSNVRGIRDVISQNRTGLLFPSDDETGLSVVLERLIQNQDLRRELSNNAFAFVSQNHGIKQWISAYEDLFKSI